MPPVLWLILNKFRPLSRGTNFLELFFSFYFSPECFVFLSTPLLYPQNGDTVKGGM